MDLPEVQAYRKNDHNYFFPRMTYEDPSYWCMDRGLLIRKDWLDNLGLEMPTNAEELLEVMRAFTEDDPNGSGAADTIGFAYNDVFPTSQQIACFGYTDNRWVKMEDGNWKQPVFEEVTLPLIDFLRTAYKNGWMDQDFAFPRLWRLPGAVRSRPHRHTRQAEFAQAHQDHIRSVGSRTA